MLRVPLVPGFWGPGREARRRPNFSVGEFSQCMKGQRIRYQQTGEFHSPHLQQFPASAIPIDGERRWSFLKMRWSALGCVISLQSLVTWSCRSTCICWSMSQGAGSYLEPFRPSSCRFRCAAAKDHFGRRIITISTSHRIRSSWRSCDPFIAIRGPQHTNFVRWGGNRSRAASLPSPRGGSGQAIAIIKRECTET